MAIEFQLPEAVPIGRQSRLPEAADDPTMRETFGAAFRTENIVGSWLTRESRDFEAVEGYDPWGDIGGYEPHADAFVSADSPEETAAIKRQIDREREDRQTLQAAGGWGMAAMFAAGTVDPVFLASMAIPVAGAASKAGSVLKIAAAGAAGTAASEVGLQATQETRTGLESALNITSATLFSGLVGAAVTTLSRRQTAQLTKALEDDFDDALPVNHALGDSTAGASAVSRGTLEDETMVGSAGMADAVGFMNPLLRAMRSPVRATRQAMQDLAENSFLFRKNRQGVANPTAIETLIKRHDGRIASGIEATRDQFKRYRTAAPVRATSGGGEAVEYLGTARKLNYREFREQVSIAMRNNDAHSIPEVAAAARYYRKHVFDPMKARAQELGLLANDVEVVGDASYLTRMYRHHEIKQRPQEFDRIIRDWLVKSRGMDATEALTAARDIRGRILGTPAGHIPVDIVKTAGPLKERVLDIESSKIADFLETDIDVVAEYYVRTLAPQIEITARFGDKEMSQVLQNVTDQYEQLIAKAKPGESEGLIARRNSDINDVQSVRDLMMGTYAAPKDPTSFAVRANRRMRDFNFIRMLGGMTISAIPDLALPVFVHGLRQYGKTLGQMIAHPQTFSVAAAEAKKWGIGLDMTLNTRFKALADIQEVSDLGSKMDRVSRTATSAFGVATLMSPWNAAMKQFSAVMVQDAIINAARRGTRVQKLAQLGIDANMASRITRQFDEFGEDAGVLISHTDQWTDRQAAQVFEAAILKDVDQIIITPSKADRPLMASTELGKTVTQFKSFAFAATNKILISGLQRHDLAALNGSLLMIALGGLVYGAKQKTAGREVSTDPAVLLTEAIDRSGLMGILFDVNNITEKMTRGTVGVSALTGGPMMSRYASRNVIGALLGPTVDTVEDVTKVTGALSTGEISESDVRSMRKLVPGQNLFYLRNLFNRFEEQAADELVTAE